MAESAKRAAVVLFLVVWAAAAPATGQQAGDQRGCTLVLTPASDETQSVSVQVAEDRYVTYVGGGLNWRCGDARSYADSAVKYDVERRLKMIGSVDYEDALRTLTADTVTYYQAQDRILAEGDVELLRKSSGATLSGPVVEFYRASGGPVRRTVATGRPRLRVYPDTTPAARDTAEPVLVDADRIELLAGNEARAWGDVQITRPDLDARADSAHFVMDVGTGVLYGSPRVVGEGVTLTGQTIRTSFSRGELEEVLAEREATATGEGFRLFSDRIRGELEGRRIERLWAFGEGFSVALAPPNRMAADSLAFAFAEGRIDTLYAVGDAQAVEVGPEGGAESRLPVPLGAGDRSWVAGDTLTLAFEEDTTAVDAAAGEARVAAADSVPNAGDSELRRLEARGGARAYRILAARDGGDRPARHYQVGSEIVVHFRDGAARRVEGQRAIGVHLDPLPPGATPDTAAADTTGGAAPSERAARSDTAPVPANEVLPDSAAVTPDSAVSPPDTTGSEEGRGR